MIVQRIRCVYVYVVRMIGGGVWKQLRPGTEQKNIENGREP